MTSLTSSTNIFKVIYSLFRAFVHHNSSRYILKSRNLTLIQKSIRMIPIDLIYNSGVKIIRIILRIQFRRSLKLVWKLTLRQDRRLVLFEKIRITNWSILSSLSSYYIISCIISITCILSLRILSLIPQNTCLSSFIQTNRVIMILNIRSTANTITIALIFSIWTLTLLFIISFS